MDYHTGFFEAVLVTVNILRYRTGESDYMDCDICMLVNNNVTNDVRVMKEATSLASHGFRVIVIGLVNETEKVAREENVNGFTVVRIFKNNSFFWIRRRDQGSNSKMGVFNPNRLAFSFYDHFPYRAFPARLARAVYYRILGPLWRILTKIFHGQLYDGLTKQLREVNAHWYHAHDFPALEQIMLAGIPAAKIVYDSHELFFDRQPTDSPKIVKWRKYVFERMQEKAYAGRIATIITVSDSIADHMMAKWKVRRPIVVRNAVDLRSLGKKGAHFQIANKKIVVHSGNITFGRHLPELVAALSFLPEDIALVLMGEAREYILTTLLKIANSNGVDRRLIIQTPVSLQDVIPTLEQADLGAVLFTQDALNYKLGLPNKFFEYVAAGLPIVVGRAQEIAAIVREYNLGVVCDETNPRAIAAAIQEVLDPENYDRFRSNAKAAREVLNWEHEEQTLVKLYQALDR